MDATVRQRHRRIRMIPRGPFAAACGVAAVLACVAPAGGQSPSAAEGVTVTLPPSDVVAGTRPYVIALKAPPAFDGRSGQATLVLRRAEPGLEQAPPVTSSTAFVFAKGDTKAARNVAALAVDVSALAEGEYTGQLALAVGIAGASFEELGGDAVEFLLLALVEVQSLVDAIDAGLIAVRTGLFAGQLLRPRPLAASWLLGIFLLSECGSGQPGGNQQECPKRLHVSSPCGCGRPLGRGDPPSDVRIVLA